ncbi:hypothetical protein BpHYR1_008059 [Brachionus plicatilis]|uniref:Uncharacterized protein n=1 Tax=Brachionus plicatilis TaxID=10195 RepID=A0A3M7T313_BRAPC|nr:hypothetical protein BpHYR1_008059 [Brachionus plicatilis]
MATSIHQFPEKLYLDIFRVAVKPTTPTKLKNNFALRNLIDSHAVGIFQFKINYLSFVSIYPLGN